MPGGRLSRADPCARSPRLQRRSGGSSPQRDGEIAEVDAVADRVVCLVVVEGRQVFQPGEAVDERREAVDEEREQREGRGAAEGNAPCGPVAAASGEGEGAGRRPKNARWSASAPRSPSAMPPPPIGTPTTSPTKVPSAITTTLVATAAALARTRRERVDRVGQRPGRGCPPPPRRRSGSTAAVIAIARDHQRPVDGADLAAHPAGERSVVGAAEQVASRPRAGRAFRSNRRPRGTARRPSGSPAPCPTAVERRRDRAQAQSQLEGRPLTHSSPRGSSAGRSPRGRRRGCGSSAPRRRRGP